MNAESSPAVPLVVAGVSIPIRNLWLLLFYASDLYELVPETSRVEAERAPERFVDLATRMACDEIERRLTRGLSTGYMPRHETTSAVRDRIDHLGTVRGGHLARGRVVCHFEEMTRDTPRHRYVLAALASVVEASSTNVDTGLQRRCRTLVGRLQREGVTLAPLDRNVPRREVFGHFDRDDARMLTAARMLVERTNPSDVVGSSTVGVKEQAPHELRRLFETAMRNFYAVNLAPEWSAQAEGMSWPSDDGPLHELMPRMRTDITLRSRGGDVVVIDTKFTSALSKGDAYRPLRLRSSHLYQLYAYVRSQTDTSADARRDGLLLYPSTLRAPDIDVASRMHGHLMRAATVDLSTTPEAIRRRLLHLVAVPGQDEGVS